MCLVVLVLFPVSSARADTMTVTGPQDFYFTFSEPTLITFRTYAQQYGIDSMLWFYDDQGNLLVANDDWFGLDSYLEYTVQPGITYRLRTGVCCWDPNAWYGSSYTVESNGSLITTPEPTTTTTTTTIVETTTTIEETTTTTEVVQEETTTVPEETTTTIEETTTTTEPETTTTTEQVTTTTTEAPPPPPKPTSSEVPTTWPASTTPTTTPSTTAPTESVPVTTETPPTGTSTPSSPPSIPQTSPSTPPETAAPPPVTATDGDVPASSADVPSAGTETPTVESTDLVTADNSTLLQIISNTSFNEISIEDGKAIIESIEFDQLTPTQIEEVVSALNGAPDEVKQTFENKVNVYSGQFDSYVPSGSVITVGQRRVVIAASTATMLAPTPTSRRKAK